eukprot:TRINITY_DN6187_c0_g3_i1.p1 TRINITY_DN6187_c0_g3~~TRINITY_DN6187_c0_g3_i1.p1  ORF type:complete len:379 (-),score=46.05 TRINITY_DN6187_c0_g3_i1:207-1343(-)
MSQTDVSTGLISKSVYHYSLMNLKHILLPPISSLFDECKREAQVEAPFSPFTARSPSGCQSCVRGTYLRKQESENIPDEANGLNQLFLEAQRSRSPSVSPPSSRFKSQVDQARTSPPHKPIRRKHFRLLQEPFDQQRKSYVNENRHILPKPLIICPVAEDVEIAQGNVSVHLVTETMQELDSSKKSILHGAAVQLLDENHKASFALKIMDTSEGSRFRLRFTIRYQLKDDPRNYEDVVVSQAFRVTSNKKAILAAECERTCELKPYFGPHNEPTEVWIRGRGFSKFKNIRVFFGTVPAEITDLSEDNLITCISPLRLDLSYGASVAVSVVYDDDQGNSYSVKSDRLLFRYEVAEGSKKRKSQSNSPNFAQESRRRSSE